MAYDAASAAALEAELTSRADANNFTIQVLSTSRRYMAHPLQDAFAPQTEAGDVVLITWGALYRRKRLGDAFICDAGVALLARAAMLEHAKGAFDLLDIKLRSYGFRNPTPL